MNIALNSKVMVSNFCEPYVIAELGSNHNGDMEIARRLIAKAREAGADCVKFQSWTKDSIFSKKVYEDNRFLADDYRKRSDYNLEQIVEKFSISESQLLEMKKFSDEIGIDCNSTPFSKAEVDFLVDRMKVGFIKVASMDLNNYPFLDYIARKGLPVVISTGLSTLGEIDRAIETIEKAGNARIVLLHCIANYPPKDEEVNLNNIETFQKIYPYPIGFSDHTSGFSIPIAAAAKGACVIEKHFTLDKNMFGWDHKISADFDELKTICSETRRVVRALGSFRVAAEESAEKKGAFRRSIVCARAVRRGEIISEGDVDFKRPGTGLAPEYKDFVVGRTAKRDIPFDKVIEPADLV